MNVSQTQKIRLYLAAGGRLTGLTALTLFGSMRLPARISDIKQAGVQVMDRWVLTDNGKRVKEYYMEGVA